MTRVLARDPSGTLAWYDWRSAFFPKDRNHRAQVALWTLINTPFYGRVNVSRRSVQLMLPHSYSRSLCPKNIPRESSRKCNSPRRDFRRITDRSFSSLEIACGMAGRGIGWSSSWRYYVCTIGLSRFSPFSWKTHGRDPWRRTKIRPLTPLERKHETRRIGNAIIQWHSPLHP